MKSLTESILDSIKAGRKEYIESKLEEAIPGIKRDEDFMYDQNTGKIMLWSVPNDTKIIMHKWPDDLKFVSFEPFVVGVKITVVGDKEYKKFLEVFDCCIGNYSGPRYKPGSKQFVTVHFTGCKVEGKDFIHRSYCNFIFDKCNGVNLQEGPNVTYIKLKDCTNVQMPYGHDNLRALEIND